MLCWNFYELLTQKWNSREKGINYLNVDRWCQKDSKRSYCYSCPPPAKGKTFFPLLTEMHVASFVFLFALKDELRNPSFGC